MLDQDKKLLSDKYEYFHQLLTGECMFTTGRGYKLVISGS